MNRLPRHPSQTELDELCITTIRCLAMDAIQKAKSGHPGMPMGMAAAAYALWTRHLRYNPVDPRWVNRDRFVLSGGHGCMLLYSLLHLAGYDLSLEEIKNFRQWGSKTPGHPEYGHTPGVEATTGPLGQGLANAVGMAIAESYLAAYFNRPGHTVVDHRIYVIAGDGCLQEGVGAEACSLAGHLGLNKLMVLYDDNHISIDGDTALSFSEDVKGRFSAYGWFVQEVSGDGNDLDAIDRAITAAKAETKRPSLIKLRTHIGYGSPNKQDTAEAHGSPLGPEEVALTKERYGWDPAAHFMVPPAALERMRAAGAAGAGLQAEWQKAFEHYAQAYPGPAAEFRRAVEHRLPEGISAKLPTFDPASSLATREAQGKVLDALMPSLPMVLGGSADLTPSNNTRFKGATDFTAGERTGRYIRYGVREHAMGAIMNGIALSGMLIPYGGTFFVFSDYMRPAIRVAALSGYPAIFVFTHDSIGLGEDGPTHQPVEQLASLRAMPGLTVIRPADATETAAAWMFALTHRDRPIALALSRQKTPVLDRGASPPADLLARGAYVLADTPQPRAMILATGTEVAIALQARAVLEKEGIPCRVVSMPSWDLFESQPAAYREAVLPPAITARVGVEAGVGFGWERYLGTAGAFVGMHTFGASAPVEAAYRGFGITTDAVVAAVRKVLA